MADKNLGSDPQGEKVEYRIQHVRKGLDFMYLGQRRLWLGLWMTVCGYKYRQDGNMWRRMEGAWPPFGVSPWVGEADYFLSYTGHTGQETPGNYALRHCRKSLAALRYRRLQKRAPRELLSVTPFTGTQSRTLVAPDDVKAAEVAAELGSWARDGVEIRTEIQGSPLERLLFLLTGRMHVDTTVPVEHPGLEGGLRIIGDTWVEAKVERPRWWPQKTRSYTVETSP